MSRQRRNFLSSRHAANESTANGIGGAGGGATKGSERTPLLNSISAASESLVMNKSATGEIQTGVSWGLASFLLVNTALGAGMLNYPYAYNQIGGILAAAAMQLVLLVFITSTMFILVYCANFNQDDTYHDVLLSMCGKRAQQLSALSILLTCYGINITFLVIIGDQYDRIFTSLLPELFDECWYLDRKFTIFMTSILFIWPMCYAKRLDFLKHASILGLFAMLYVAFLTVYEHYKLDEATIAAVLSRHLAAAIQLEQSHHDIAANSTTHQTTSNASTLTASQESTISNETATAAATIILNQPKRSVQWFEPLAVVPILCFAYQTHEVVVPVYACMKERFVCSFMKASICCLVILFFLYNLVGAYGYLTFGEHVAADIMSLYDAKDPIVVVGIIALVIKFVTTYPPLMFCGRTALDGLYGEMRKLSADEFKTGEKLRRYVITTIWFFSTVALAVFAPDISVTLQLLGSMASINVFVFPGMCLVALTRRLRRARLALLMGELPDGQFHQQRAKDYYLISGSYLGAMKKNAALNNQQMNLTNNHHHHLNQHRQNNQLLANVNECCGLSSTSGANNHRRPSISSRPQQHFTATFASLIEFENNVDLDTCSSGDDKNGADRLDSNPPSSYHMNGIASSSNGAAHSSNGLNGYGSTADARQQRRQEEFERLITNGSLWSSSQNLASSSFARPINDSLDDDYSDCSSTIERARCCNMDCNNQQSNDLINGISAANHRHRSCGCATGGSNANKSLLDSDRLAKDVLLDKTSTNGYDNKTLLQHVCQANSQQLYQSGSCLQNSWKNKSTTGSLLDRLGSSIAPSTVSQIGISRLAAVGLYLFSGLLILFGAFIFTLELVSVFGFL